MKRSTRTLCSYVMTGLILAGLVVPATSIAAPFDPTENKAETSLAQKKDPASHEELTHTKQKRVFIVLAPYLTWEDISAKKTPTIYRLAEDGAIANINARSRTRETTEVGSPLEGALTISAGSWAVPSAASPAAYWVKESYEYGSAGEAFERMTGESPADNSIVFLGMPMTERENQARSADIKLGSLGQAIKDAKGTTIAVGNSDVGYVTGEQRKVRPAGLAAMDESGMVSLGDVSQRLIANDPDAPFGIKTDIQAFSDELDKSLLASLEQNPEGPVLIALDPGDLNRAHKFAPQVSDAVAEKQQDEALQTLDTIAGYAKSVIGPSDVLLITSQSSSDADGFEGFGPVIAYGNGYKGLLTSSSTHQDGLITSPDISAMSLSIFGIERPVEMSGNPVTSDPSKEPLGETISNLVSLNNKAIAVESSKRTTIQGYIILSIIIFALATLLITRSPKDPPRRLRGYFTITTVMLLGVGAFPLATYIMFLVVFKPQSAPVASISLFVALALVWGIALLLWKFSSLKSRAGFVFLMLGTTVVFTVDQWVGAPLASMGYLSYSPLLAARFYGIGNEGAALLFGASVTGFALLLDGMRQSRARWVITNIVFPISALVCTFTMAAPMLGANVGVVIWGMLGYAFAWFLFSGRKVTWKFILAVFAGIAVLLAAFIAYDLLGPGTPTHLARAIVSADEGGLGELGIIIMRKIQTSIRVLTFTNWSFMLIAVIVFLVFMRLRPTGEFAQTITENPMLGHAITASCVAGVAAMLTEDSGIIIPALIFIYSGIAIVWAILKHTQGKVLSQTDVEQEYSKELRDA